jgi:hypothetical protein
VRGTGQTASKAMHISFVHNLNQKFDLKTEKPQNQIHNPNPCFLIDFNQYQIIKIINILELQKFA